MVDEWYAMHIWVMYHATDCYQNMFYRFHFYTRVAISIVSQPNDHRLNLGCQPKPPLQHLQATIVLATPMRWQDIMIRRSWMPTASA
jgi:hypothetical protein